jgi:DNA-binding NtrC family response regulator
MTNATQAMIDEERLAEARVLLVDDDQLVTSSLSSFFCLEMDFEPTVFNDAREALNYLAENRPDLIISDFFMPEVDGIQLLQQARKLYPEVPRVLLTGYADKENAIKAINDVQLYRYIEKPWENDLLRAVVANGVARIYLLRALLDKLEVLAETSDEMASLRRSLVSVFC